MFSEFLTLEGERLLAKSIEGTATITFTKMELGDGDRDTSSRNISSLENKRMTLDIYSVSLSGDNSIQIISILKSENIESGFYFREKGIYATDGTTEILFLYGNAGSMAEWVENVQSSVFERTIRTIIALTSGDAVNITLQDGVYASGEDMQKSTNDILAAIGNIKLDGDWAKYSQAESILSILDTLCKAYTAARAGKLDNLDAAVSSRAPANTALSNATWTNARAGKIDNLDTTMSSRAPASTALSNAVWTDGRAGLVDRLGYINDYMSSRAPASTALSNAVWTNARASYLDYIVNGTFGLPAIRSAIGAAGIPGTVKRVVRGVVDTKTTTTVSIGVTVDPNKVIIILNPSKTAGTPSSLQTWTPYVVSVSSTTFVITNNYSQNQSGVNVGWQLIEFY